MFSTQKAPLLRASSNLITGPVTLCSRYRLLDKLFFPPHQIVLSTFHFPHRRVRRPLSIVVSTNGPRSIFVSFSPHSSTSLWTAHSSRIECHDFSFTHCYDPFPHSQRAFSLFRSNASNYVIWSSCFGRRPFLCLGWLAAIGPRQWALTPIRIFFPFALSPFDGELSFDVHPIVLILHWARMVAFFFPIFQVIFSDRSFFQASISVVLFFASISMSPAS